MATLTTPDVSDRTLSPPVRLLLAEDDGELRDALAAVLRKNGFDVDVVRSGIGLVDRLAAGLLDGAGPPADVIITDVRMPGCNGLNVVEGLRNNGWTLPIIVISAFGDDDMRARVQRMDAVALLEKPFAAPVLEQTIRDLLAG